MGCRIACGKFVVKDNPKTCKDPIQREGTVNILTTYLKNRKRAPAHEKYALLGASGIKGIGKTTFLMYGALSVAPKCGMKGGYVTFNGCGAQKQAFLKSRGRGHSHLDAFGHMLISWCGIDEECVYDLPFKDCLELYRRMLGCKSQDLALFIDEIGDLGESQAADTLSELMSFMDQGNGTIVFVFSHIIEHFLQEAATGSGREVKVLPLPALPIDVWKMECGLKDWNEAASGDKGIHQLLLSCCGHPRSLFDGLKEASSLLPRAGHDVPLRDLIWARKAMMAVCKFNDPSSRDIGPLLTKWFGICPDESEVADAEGVMLQRQRDGLLLSVPGSPAKDFILPILVQWWAQEHRVNSSLAFHLDAAYAADAVLEPGGVLHMTRIMFNVEARFGHFCFSGWGLAYFFSC